MNSLQIFDITGIFLLALIIGGMFFFAAIMTPLVFTKLSPEISGPFIRQAFPVYSQAMAGMTLAAALSLWSFNESIYLGDSFYPFYMGLVMAYAQNKPLSRSSIVRKPKSWKDFQYSTQTERSN